MPQKTPEVWGGGEFNGLFEVQSVKKDVDINDLDIDVNNGSNLDCYIYFEVLYPKKWFIRFTHKLKTIFIVQAVLGIFVFLSLYMYNCGKSVLMDLFNCEMQFHEPHDNFIFDHAWY